MAHVGARAGHNDLREGQNMYDVAFSFRYLDLALAETLKDKLDPPLKCFVYSRSQDSIAASDGLDTFRTTFRNESRLNVVLFRKDWGQTPWTGVEEIAIKDSCLQTKYRNLVVVRLDDAPTPSWVPDTHQLFDLTLYTADELIGVIKSRAQAVGVAIATESPIDRVRRISRDESFVRETKEHFRSPPGIKAAHALIPQIKDELKAQTDAIATEHPEWQSRFGQGNPREFEFRFAGIRLFAEMTGCFSNDVADAVLRLDFSQLCAAESPNRLALEKLALHRTRLLGVCWRLSNGTALSASGVAEHCITKMIDLRAKVSTS